VTEILRFQNRQVSSLHCVRLASLDIGLAMKTNDEGTTFKKISRLF
jgi:hypothetical protein